ncbi:MAG TPA: proprotein convertase P-domain-containing protein, partial [Phycisphaerales bacterium]|nr:proprotein convertase P-domain-containing protein [Phycisphaerales bacterium]
MPGIKGLLTAACSAFIVTTLSAWPGASGGNAGQPNLGNQGVHQPASGANAAPIDLPATREDFLRSKPGVQFQEWKKSTRLYGNVFATGATARAAAEQFRMQGAKAVFGAEAIDLKPTTNYLPQGVNEVPVMYQPETGTYKFTAEYYTQQRGGLDVFRSRLVLLSRNNGTHDVVLASAELHDLGDFVVPANAVNNVNTGPAFATAREDFNKNAEFSNARNVIFAGTDGVKDAPVLGVEFIASAMNPGTLLPEIWLYVCDAQTGKLLFKENQILDVDVTGNVSGMATTGNAADVCNPEVLTGMPYAKVNIGATTAYADVNGNFTIPNAGSGQVTVGSVVGGQYFVENNQHSPGTSTQSANVTPPGPVNFIYNQPNTDEFQRAEVNAYIQANVVRDYCLAQNPTYPTISTQTNFPLNVNINLTCNAFYDPIGHSLNFYVAGGGCTNTANATVVHHEYGHHMVQMAGSGQAGYGEGMGDCQSLLIADDSCLGNGFHTCGECLRSADNNLQYPYSAEAHEQGRLLSGCVWSTRNELLATHPADYLTILRHLTVNSILLHTGTDIDPSITVDFLTLDDTDGNILNGTPHYNEINAGFGAHNMPGPELDVGISVSPNVNLTSSGLAGGPFSPTSQIYNIQNVDTVPINYQVTHSATWVDISNASGTIPVGNTVQVTVSLNAGANSLGNGLYNDTVQFTNLTNNLGNKTRMVSLEIGRIVYPSTDTPKPMPDLSTVTSNLNVTDSYCIGDVDVDLNITHTYIGDLTVDLKSPQGTTVRLHNRTGSSTDNIMKRYDDGTTPPDGPGVLADFNGEIVTGTWQLKVIDNASGDSGTLNNWALRIVPSGSVCPPEANDVTLTVPAQALSPIALSASSSSPASLVYRIQT